jgi:DNA-binding NtrC family response regulator
LFNHLPILIVEDEWLIASALADAVSDLDGAVVGPVATVGEALALLDNTPIAAAVLDALLADRDVTPVALRLFRQGIPFVLHSGTGPPRELAILMPRVPVAMKPLEASSVLACLRDEMDGPPLSPHGLSDRQS